MNTLQIFATIAIVTSVSYYVSYENQRDCSQQQHLQSATLTWQARQKCIQANSTIVDD